VESLEGEVSVSHSSGEPVRTSIEMPSITEEERNAIKQEVNDALERISIDKETLGLYFKTSNKGKPSPGCP